MGKFDFLSRAATIGWFIWKEKKKDTAFSHEPGDPIRVIQRAFSTRLDFLSTPDASHQYNSFTEKVRCHSGAKALNLSSIEVQGDNKQVVKFLCITEAEPSSLGVCFHFFQIFVPRVRRYLFNFPGVLGRQTRRPTGLHNPLTRINHLSHGFLALFWIFLVIFMLMSLLGISWLK
ncbi:hypothetical protein RHMOL_Rhmol11G0221100 [Rhododendron molle]|uniref:Uncharacterized protein n=1 Tax=Rhododendron molle TaxID=49168 RepID=A0ACC0LWA5_RHOML|nr:hypothetical protein RHMOL_Rhmol11G0221100 [Rhododendron molle]